MTHAAATVDQMLPPYPAERGLDVYNKKLGMWVFLASEVMFFAALIGTYVILRFGATGEWARPGIVLNIKITAFHGFHVTCGVISMAYLYFTKALPGKYSKQDYGGIETVGLYWHFVDLVWIILFTIVYLI